MSQNDMIIDNASGATVRADINAALQALASTGKGNSRPATPYAGQLWVDDNTPSSSVWTLYVYDGTDDIALGQIDTTNNLFTLANTAFASTDSGGTGVTLECYHNSASPAVSDLQNLQWAFNSTTGVKRTFNLIRAVIEDATNASEDSRFDFQTIVAGTLGTRMKLTQGLVVGSPTGDDKGTGTVNATAVYDDNTLLTCYVFEQATKGTVTLDKWDAKVPGDRTHEGAHKFAARIGTEYDPLDLDKYARHWKDKGHLTSLPNGEKFDPEAGITVGSLLQRLWETVEIQAVHIETLNQRTKDQDARIAALEAR